MRDKEAPGVRVMAITVWALLVTAAVLAVGVGGWRYWQAYQRSPAALARKATAAYQKLEMDRAIIYWQQALARAPNEPGLHYNLALSLESTGDIKGAMAEYRKAIAINPVLAAPRFNLALLHLRQGEREEAETLLLEAVAQAPAFAGAHLLLARLYQQDGQRDLARERYLQVVSLGTAGRGDLADAYFQLGRLYYEEGAREKAAAAWQRVLELQPGHPQAAQYLRRLEEDRGGP